MNKIMGNCDIGGDVTDTHKISIIKNYLIETKLLLLDRNT